jgi:Eukaryotic protein of unknown function (DUF953)
VYYFFEILPFLIKRFIWMESKSLIVELANFEAAVKAESKAFILFTGNKDENGVSWCPDCVEAEPWTHGQVEAKAKELGIKFFTCFVGKREEYCICNT